MLIARQYPATSSRGSDSRKSTRKHPGASGTQTDLYQYTWEENGPCEVRYWPYDTASGAQHAIGRSARSERVLKAKIGASGQQCVLLFHTGGGRMTSDEALEELRNLEVPEYTSMLQISRPWMKGHVPSVSSVVEEQAVSSSPSVVEDQAVSNSTNRDSRKVRKRGRTVYAHFLDSHKGTQVVGVKEYSSRTECASRLSIPLTDAFSKSSGILRVLVRNDQCDQGRPPSCTKVPVWPSVTNSNTSPADVSALRETVETAYKRGAAGGIEIKEPPKWIDTYWDMNCAFLESKGSEAEYVKEWVARDKERDQADAETLFLAHVPW